MSCSFTATASSTPSADCPGVATGTITMNVTGAGGPVTYILDGGTPAPGWHFVGVGPGTHTITVIDSSDMCSEDITVVVAALPPLVVTSSSSSTTCSGTCDGMIMLTPTGGTPPYSYNWGGIAPPLPTISGLCPGTYTCLVTDANGCTFVAVQTVTGAAPITGTTSSTPATCSGICDGSVIATVTGGTPPYNYMWDMGITSPVVTGLCAGIYICYITDANGCGPLTLTAVVNGASAITPSVSTTPASCGVCDGTATATVTGGTAPYTYQVGSGPIQTSGNFTGLCAGVQNLMVTDANGCTGDATVTVNSSGGVVATAVTTTAPGCGMCNGVAEVMASGGTGTYTYSINGSTYVSTSTFTGLCAGVYVFYAQDASGCIGIYTLNVTSPAIPGLTVTPTIINESAGGLNDGSIELTLSGSGPYTFLWSNGATTQNIYSLAGGTYTVTVSDGSGNCNTYTYAVTTTPTYGHISGQVYIDANGNCIFDAGDTPVSYSGVSAGSSAITYTNTAGEYNFYVLAGTYTVAPTVSPYLTISSGCSVSGTVTVTGGSTQTVNFPMTTSGTLCDGQVTVYNSGVVPGFSGSNYIYVYNSGYTVLSGTLTATVPQYTTYAGASVTPASVSGDTATFTISGLAPLTGMYIYLFYTCPPNPSLLGFPAISYAHLDVTSCTDINNANNTSYFTRVITGSYDPNDKAVHPSGAVEYDTNHEFLYHIRFQNTGNGPAVNISVTDTLSAFLDPNSIQIVDASHDFDFNLLSGNIMHFRFNNIMLTDSTTDEPGSHGHITFRIKNNSTLAVGSVVENTANIYFDFNPPVITNTTHTGFVITGIAETNPQGFDFTVYPNPTSGTAWIKLSDNSNATMNLFDVCGKLVMTKEISSTENSIDLSSLGKGIYTMTVSNGETKVSKKLISK